MAYKKSFNEPEPASGPACVYLRNKAMYVTGDRKSLDEMDLTSTHHCWCNLTQHDRGPDKDLVDRESCVSGRECYRDCL
jgi:hypothetical protein